MIEKSPAGELQPVIMDFGLARDANDENTGMTESGAIMGTAAFMSPEQARGDVKRLDRRTDVYSLGATLYDLLAGKPPFAASSMADTLLKVIIEEAPPLRDIRQDTPEALDIIVSKCLNKEPEQRYHTAKAFAEDLSRFLSAERIVGKRLGLVQRLRWRAKNNPRTAVAVVVMILSILGFIGQGVNVYVQNVRKEREAKRQAELAQRLGQEITVMEWLLRTARGMPAHDLNREKKIVRERMSALQSEFSAFGPGGRALAHYALGRGHMGLHEYPEALKELQQAIDQGFTQGEAYYALGVVLGKHYEKAMHEARLAGGGEWAKKKLQQIEPQYLRPAIDALTKARAARGGSSEYLEALLAYYKRDFETSIHQADAAIQKSPWLYEAIKLQGDVHLERALQARDSGKNEEAENEFATAVKRFSEAGTVGESDAEVFEGLAEAWVRKLEMYVTSGRPIGLSYDAAVGAADRIGQLEPPSVIGHLKKAFAAYHTMSTLAQGKGSTERVEQCLTEAQTVLSQQPENPYAQEVSALCYLFAAELAQSRGDSPLSYINKSITLLESATRQNPQFLWGLNDLSMAHAVLGMHFQNVGNTEFQDTFRKALNYAEKAIHLDSSYLTPIQNSLWLWSQLAASAQSKSEIDNIITKAESLYSSCMRVNNKFQQCKVNYLLVHAKSAQRLSDGGSDPSYTVSETLRIKKEIDSIGGDFLDAEQFTLLTHYIEAVHKKRHGESLEAAVKNSEKPFSRCLQLSSDDPVCRYLETKIQLLQAESIDDPEKRSHMNQELHQKAKRQLQSHDKSIESLIALALCDLSIIKSQKLGRAAHSNYLSEGIASIERAIEMNPKNTESLVIKGDLLLLQLGSAPADPARLKRIAANTYTQAATIDPYLQVSLKSRTPVAIE